MSTTSINSDNYAERQLIVVMPDDFVDSIRKFEEEIIEENKETSLKEAAILAMKLAIKTNIFTMAIDAYKALEKLKQNGFNATYIKKSESSGLTFPPGHPRNGVLYVAHPADDDVYYAMASFHRMAFEHKFSEAIDILMSLGANKIKVEHIRGWSHEFCGELAVSTPTGNLSATAHNTSKISSSILYEATLDGHTTPSIPDQLAWYKHEPTWQSIAKGRIQHGLREFSLSVAYEDNFGINAGLKISAVKSGLELGGRFEDHQATIWRISGTFTNG